MELPKKDTHNILERSNKLHLDVLRPPKVIRGIIRSKLSKLVPKRPMIFLVIEDVNKVLQQA